ncbi:MAG: hypothetical protein ACYC8T_31480, partial [Myxococcaceae bacterium]
MTEAEQLDEDRGSDWKMYAAFAIAGVAVGLSFPPVASFFVNFREGLLTWFVLVCVAAGEVMALAAAVAVRFTVIKRLRDRERVEREKRHALQQALHAYIAFAEQISQGKLAVRLGKDTERYGDKDVIQLGRQLDAMVESLHAMSKQLAGATDQTTSASALLLAASAQQSTGAAEQAAAVSEITTTVEEVRQTADQAAERAQS